MAMDGMAGKDRSASYLRNIIFLVKVYKEHKHRNFFQ
jgi:hypothetical protein